MEVFARRLKELRESRDLSQKKVANDLFISNTSLSNYELNVSSPPLELIINMAEYYDVSLEYLFGISDLKYKDSHLSQDENNLLNIFKSLPVKKQALIIDLVTALGENKNSK